MATFRSLKAAHLAYPLLAYAITKLSITKRHQIYDYPRKTALCLIGNPERALFRQD